MYDLNTAETGSVFDLLPDGTVARAVLVLNKGGHGEGGWCKLSKNGDQMLDAKWVITVGKHAKRHVFENMLVSGSEKAVAITMKNLRALIEGHFGIDPNDMSDAARQARMIPSLGSVNGLEGCILIGVEKGTDGHPDKNRVKAVIAPGAGNYLKPGEIQQNPPTATTAPATPAYGQTATQGTYQAPPAYGSAPNPGYGQTTLPYTPPADNFAFNGDPAGPKPGWGH